MTQHDLFFCRWGEILTVFTGVQHIVKVQAYSLWIHLHDGKTEVSGKMPLAEGGTLGRSVPALAFTGGTLYHLLEASGREVLLVMSVAGKIDMNVALIQERSFDKRPGALLVGIPPVMSTVVDGLMPEGNFPSVGTTLITQRSLDRGDLKTIQIPPLVGVGVQPVNLYPVRQQRDRVVEGPAYARAC